jgi:hypothetical protein
MSEQETEIRDRLNSLPSVCGPVVGHALESSTGFRETRMHLTTLPNKLMEPTAHRTRRGSFPNRYRAQDCEAND